MREFWKAELERIVDASAKNVKGKGKEKEANPSEVDAERLKALRAKLKELEVTVLRLPAFNKRLTRHSDRIRESLQTQ